MARWGRRWIAALAAVSVVLVATAAPAPAATRPIRVLVIGDSTANGLGASLALWGASHGNVVVVDRQAINGCPLVDANAMNTVSPPQWARVPAACRDWGRRMLAQRAWKPDVVLAVFGPTQAADVRPANTGTITNVKNADFRWATVDQAIELRNDFPKAVFVWASAPRTFFATGSIPESRWVINDPTRIAAWNALVLAMSKWKLSVRVHMAQYIETLPGGWRNRTVRPDGVHVSGSALVNLAAWIGKAVVGDYRYFYR
jgi:hypothetical protein